jgi:L-alanine-DL-glutamate epimerase-like enolase superfamily enzyme
VYEIQSTFETEPASEAEPQPKPAQPSQTPGQSEAAPSGGTHDSSRTIRPVNAMRHAASETASFMFDINSRSLL